MHLLLHQLHKDPTEERCLAILVPDRWVGGMVLRMLHSVNEAFGNGFETLYSEHDVLTESLELKNLIMH